MDAYIISFIKLVSKAFRCCVLFHFTNTFRYNE